MARRAHQEAREIRRKLAEADPQTYQNDLAMTLNNLGAFYRETREFGSAREAYEEARNIRRKLAEANPQTYQNDLATTLNNLGILYCDTREFAAARRAFEEAHDIYSTLAAADPKTYQNDLAMTLNNLGVLHNNLQDHASARRTYYEAIALAEAAEESTDRHLAKGMALGAYNGLLLDTIGSPSRAFALAAAKRDAGTRSRDIGVEDIDATQTVLREASRYSGRETALLIVNAWDDNTGDHTMTLGFMSAHTMQWFSVEAKGWGDLLPSDDPNKDQAARQRLARDIWHRLPAPVQVSLDPQHADHAMVWISGDEYYSAFPWELLRFGDGEEDYLGLHQPLPRIGSILAPSLETAILNAPLGRATKTAAIIAPHTTGKTPLEGVLYEAEGLKQRIAELGGELAVYDTGEGAHDGLMRDALEARPDILYFTGHGGIVADEEVLVLHTESPRGPLPQDKITYFGRYQLDQIASANSVDRLLEYGPLVVLNSCLSGRMKSHGGRREDMIDALLSHGAGAVLATALPIYDAVGEALGAALFSEETISRPTMGESVVTARRQLARGICGDINSPYWGAWGMVHLHGRALAVPPFHS